MINAANSASVEEQRYNGVLILKISGMMCHHCEAYVKRALEAIDNIESAVANHESGSAIVTTSGVVDHNIIKDALSAEGYELIAIEIE